METRNTMTDDLNNHKAVEVKNRKQPAWITLTFAATILAIALTALFIAGKVIPWEPFTVYDYYQSPNEVCPFDRVAVTQDVELVDGWWFSLGTLKGETYWVDEDNKPFAGTMFDVEIEAIERQELPSNSVRLAPPEPGYWWGGGEATLTGTRLGFIAVSQDIKVVTKDPIYVKDWSECADKFGE